MILIKILIFYKFTFAYNHVIILLVIIMINSIGIDIIDIRRVKKLINKQFIEQVLNYEELILLNKKNKKIEFLAGRIAAKEAVIKAINDYENPHMKEITILNKDNGMPYVIYQNYNILISISHEKEFVIAEAILLN